MCIKYLKHARARAQEAGAADEDEEAYMCTNIACILLILLIYYIIHIYYQYTVLLLYNIIQRTQEAGAADEDDEGDALQVELRHEPVAARSRPTNQASVARARAPASSHASAAKLLRREPVAAHGNERMRGHEALSAPMPGPLTAGRRHEPAAARAPAARDCVRCRRCARGAVRLACAREAGGHTGAARHAAQGRRGAARHAGGCVLQIKPKMYST